MSDFAAAVRAQYEAHPYPAWKNLPIGPRNDLDQDVLVAGCGTGQEILTDAYASPKSRFLGIDVSSASLRHAMLKAAEFAIPNVRFLQLSLLDVASLDETFDFIKSTGVLHHLENPLAGLVSLKSVLRPGGSIKFSVYSKAGRSTILKAIALRKRLGVPATDEGIEGFRQLILALPESDPIRRVAGSPDFASIAGTRDLLFHALEHNFTVPELVDMVRQAGLHITQWGPSKPLAKFQAMGFTDPLDWRQWHEAEQRRPGLFSTGMYSLVVKREP